MLTLVPVFRSDPFYKYCAVTGSGLRSAKAGVPAHFYIKCYDIFGLDPTTAKFTVGPDSDPIGPQHAAV